MAKVGWSAGIDFVSGALSKPSKNGQHSCQKMLLGTHRVAATTNPNCNRIYLRPKIERSTPPTVNELQPQLQPHLPAPEDRAFDASDRQRALHASAFRGSQGSCQGSSGGPLQGRCRSGSVHRSEGHRRWQEDHERLSLVA